MTSSNPKVWVKGEVTEGYEEVKKLFTTFLTKNYEENAQLCVYVDGVRVIDLWGSSIGDQEYGPDKLHMVFSSSKSVIAIVFGRLVDQGLVKYDDKVAKHWPEFAANGKEDVTIAQVLRHESGLSELTKSLKVEDVLRENIKQNSVGKVIEEEGLVFPHEDLKTKRSYHGVSRGYILNEVFRRVHPEGKTMGEALRDEVAGPLGLDMFIGLPEDQIDRVQTLSTVSPKDCMIHTLLPSVMGSKLHFGPITFWNQVKMFKRIGKYAQKTPKAFEGFDGQDFTLTQNMFGHSTVRAGEVPSINVMTTARSLAKLGLGMINKGEVDGVRIMSEDGVKAMHSDSTKAVMFISGQTAFTQGGVNRFEEMDDQTEDLFMGRNLNRNRNGFYGWFGYGGSVFNWHPELNISFAFVPSRMSWYDFGNTKGGQIQAKVVECVRKVKDSKK